MALFHSTTKIISRSDAGNAVAAAAYRSGTRMTCARTGQDFNYTRKREVTYRAILAPADSPAWVFDRTQLADAIEALWANKARSRAMGEAGRARVLGLGLSWDRVVETLCR